MRGLEEDKCFKIPGKLILDANKGDLKHLYVENCI